MALRGTTICLAKFQTWVFSRVSQPQKYLKRGDTNGHQRNVFERQFLKPRYGLGNESPLEGHHSPLSCRRRRKIARVGSCRAHPGEAGRRAPVEIAARRRV